MERYGAEGFPEQHVDAVGSGRTIHPVNPVFPLGELTVVAHRGVHAEEYALDGTLYRPNSIEGFLKCSTLGAPWVELDVHVSRDLRLVLQHDEVLADGRVVGELTAEALAHLDVEILDDLLAALPERTGVVVNMKPSLTDLPGKRAVSSRMLLSDSLIEDRLRNPARHLLVYGEAPHASLGLVQTFRQRGLDVPVGVYAEADATLAGMTLAAIETGARVVAAHTSSFLGEFAGPPYCAATPSETIATGHAAGVQYLAWVPALREVEQLAELGVDAVCVDDIPAVLAARGSTRQEIVA